MDMSFLFGDIKRIKSVEKTVETNKTVAPIAEKTLVKTSGKDGQAVETVAVKKETKKPAQKPVRAERKNESGTKRRTRALTADEKLQEAFIKKLHRLGGEYFEYYSVYLLERYSKMNGRRLESLKITGGDHDGGIDGEIELTDRLGFRETI